MPTSRTPAFLAVAVAALAAAGCGTPQPPAGTIAATAHPTIEIELHRDERVAMFLFGFHGARGVSGRRLRSMLPLGEEDAAALARHGEAFAPVAAAFDPYLDAHPGFDRTLLLTLGAFAGAGVEPPDPGLLAALNAFEPIYRAEFAPRHRRLVSGYASILQPQLARHGDAMARAVAREVSGTWREEPIRLDIVPYATSIGAYTNSYHIVIGAGSQEARDHALELVFHEAAHTDPMDRPLKAAASAALERHGLDNERFWHYLQFYAIGRAAQSVLGRDYVPYHLATGLSARSGPEYYAAIDEVWDRYDTLEERADAAAALVAARRPD